MATQVQFRGGSTSEHSSFTGAAREVTVDTTKDTVVVHDGSTAGGFPLAKENNPNFTGQADVGTDYLSSPHSVGPNIRLNSTAGNNSYPTGSSAFRNDAASFTERDRDTFNDSTAIIVRNNDKTNIVSGSFMRFDTIGTAGYLSNWWVGAKQEVANSTNDNTNGSSFKISQLTKNRDDQTTDRLVIERTGQVFIPGDTRIGGISSAPNIQLKNDGSATFAGPNITITSSGNYFTNANVYAGTNATLGSAPGAALISDGRVAGTRAGTGNVWEGRNSSVGSSLTSLIRANGSALFTGDVDISGEVDILENTRVRKRLNVGTANAGGMGDGVIIAGDASASNGQVMLTGRYTNADSVPIFGSMYGSANVMIGYGVRCSTTAANTFLSTAGNANWKRAALEVGGELKYKNAAAQNTAVGSEVTLTERFRIDQSGDVLIGGTIPSAPNIQLRADGQVRSDTISVGGTEASPAFSIGGNNTANFSSKVKSANTFESDRTSGSNSCFVGKLNGTGTVYINAAGKAEFAGDVVSGDDPSQSENNEGVVLRSRGTVTVNRPSGAIYQGYTTGTSSPTFAVNADGSADFSGLLKADKIRPLNPDSAAAPGLCVYNDPDTGFYRPSSNNIGISTGGAERLRISSSGNILIGGTIPSAPNIKLTNDGSCQFIAPIQANINSTNVKDRSKYEFLTTAAEVSAGSGVALALGFDGRGRTFIASQHEDNNKDHQRLSFYTSRNGSQNLALRLTGVGDAQFSNSVSIGGTAAANTIDEYEEGTWTPTIKNANATYTTQTGSYVRIGNQVTLYGQLQWTNNDAISTFIIESIPFNTSGTLNAQMGSVKFTGNANSVPSDLAYPSVETFSSSLYVRYTKTNGTSQSNWALSANSGGRIMFNITYII